MSWWYRCILLEDRVTVGEHLATLCKEPGTYNLHLSNKTQGKETRQKRNRAPYWDYIVNLCTESFFLL